MSEHPSALSRRRFVKVTAAAAGCALVPGQAGAAVEPIVWRGIALGARGEIRLYHSDPAEARAIVAAAVQEIERLEEIFSLYRKNSALSRLNRAGVLEAPPLELVELLSRAAEVSAATRGAFDVTVQPLWRRYAEHFAAGGEGPPDLAEILPLVDWRGVDVDPERIRLTRAGMAVTMNGIAQGFVADRVAGLLERRGVTRVLLDLGEIRGLGARPDGRPWQVGIAAPLGGEGLAGRLRLEGRALATSGGYGTVFDRERRFSHLLDPRSGRTAPAGRSLTVLASSATDADALSTGLAVLDEATLATLLPTLPNLSVYLADESGFRRVS